MLPSSYNVVATAIPECTDVFCTVWAFVEADLRVRGKSVQQIDENVERSRVEKAGASDKKFRDDFVCDMKELNCSQSCSEGTVLHHHCHQLNSI
jgi:hypothetical protein